MQLLSNFEADMKNRVAHEKNVNTEVKFYPEVKSQTALSALRVSCKRALNLRPTAFNFILKTLSFCFHL